MSEDLLARFLIQGSARDLACSFLGKRHIFVEKESGGLALRRGFKIDRNERFIVAEDVVTRGGRVQETIDIVRSRGGIVVAAGVIVDRSGQTKPDFGCPFLSLIEMDVETFPADKLPPDLAAIPAVKPGSLLGGVAGAGPRSPTAATTSLRPARTPLRRP